MMISLVNGNSLHVPLRAASVHMVCFSPPYWGLRDYGTASWEGGDSVCDHVSNTIRTGKGLAALGKKYRGGGHKQGEITALQYKNTCAKCGAIRKDEQIGIEERHDCLAWARGEQPCGECFVCNLRLVAAEVWRVLRSDGTFWLNLGDGYASGEIGRHDSMQGRTINGKPVTSKFFHCRQSRQGKTSQRNGRSNSDRQQRTPVAGLKSKNLTGIPWRVALALQADGWILRNDIIWSKANPMPESSTDRFTRSHEYVFLFTKSRTYYFDQEAVREPVSGNAHPRGANNTPAVHPKAEIAKRGEVRANHEFSSRLVMLPDERGRNRRTVWELPTEPFSGAHFATWPTSLVGIMIKAGTSEKGTCPTCGAQWERVVEKAEPTPAPGNPNPVRPYPASSHTQGAFSTTLHKTRTVVHTDWIPGCDCHQEFICAFCSGLGGDESGDCPVCDKKGQVLMPPKPVPAIVLDLFVGSGTTLVVARQLGRSAIGVDLNFKYLAEQAHSRLELDRLEAFEQGTGSIPPAKARRKKKTVAGQLSFLEQ